MLSFICTHLTVCFLAAFIILVIGDIIINRQHVGSPLPRVLTLTAAGTAAGIICTLTGYAILASDGLTGTAVNMICSIVFGAVTTAVLILVEGGLHYAVTETLYLTRTRSIRNEDTLQQLRAAIQEMKYCNLDEITETDKDDFIVLNYLNGKDEAYRKVLNHIDSILPEK